MPKKKPKQPNYPLLYDPEDRALWERAAKLDNRSLANWIRTVLTAEAKRQIDEAKKH